MLSPLHSTRGLYHVLQCEIAYPVLAFLCACHGVGVYAYKCVYIWLYLHTEIYTYDRIYTQTYRYT